MTCCSRAPLVHEGVRIEDAEPIGAAEPAGAVPGGVARAILRATLEHQIESALRFHTDAVRVGANDCNHRRPNPSHSAMRLPTGLGKAEQARIALADYVRRAKTMGIPHQALV